eukprot:TRINITY_DN1151_c0_g1_i1.p2 TRINITY_DN1151_c0_g1~~TRINITY_DN1151_c0_g1_i1.p2  ORF type:complete len:190 (+),score=52.07 TRINITY_DN1151_c0_g1_i1:77-571(+)
MSNTHTGQDLTHTGQDLYHGSRNLGSIELQTADADLIQQYLLSSNLDQQQNPLINQSHEKDHNNHDSKPDLWDEKLSTAPRHTVDLTGDLEREYVIVGGPNEGDFDENYRSGEIDPRTGFRRDEYASNASSQRSNPRLTVLHPDFYLTDVGVNYIQSKEACATQ